MSEGDVRFDALAHEWSVNRISLVATKALAVAELLLPCWATGVEWSVVNQLPNKL